MNDLLNVAFVQCIPAKYMINVEINEQIDIISEIKSLCGPFVIMRAAIASERFPFFGNFVIHIRTGSPEDTLLNLAYGHRLKEY